MIWPINSEEMQAHAKGMDEALALKAKVSNFDPAPAMRKPNDEDWNWAMVGAINSVEEVSRHQTTDDRTLKIYSYFSEYKEDEVVVDRRRVGIKVSGLSRYENELIGKYILSGYIRAYKPSFLDTLFPALQVRNEISD